MYLISESIDNSPYALPLGRPGLEELQDFVILQVLMFYPDEEQQNLIQDVSQSWCQECVAAWEWNSLSSVQLWESLSAGQFRDQNLRADQIEWIISAGQFRSQSLRADQLVRCSAKDGSEIRTWELIRLSWLSVQGSSGVRTWEQISLCCAQPGCYGGFIVDGPW